MTYFSCPPEDFDELLAELSADFDRMLGESDIERAKRQHPSYGGDAA